MSILKEGMKESRENYLEAIFILSKKQNSQVRSVDVAKQLDVKRPSVSRAMSILKNEGYVYNEKGSLRLSEKGKQVAEKVYEKHEVLTSFFTRYAKVKLPIAEKDACRVEHVISEETFQGIKRYINQLEN